MSPSLVLLYQTGPCPAVLCSASLACWPSLNALTIERSSAVPLPDPHALRSLYCTQGSHLISRATTTTHGYGARTVVDVEWDQLQVHRIWSCLLLYWWLDQGIKTKSKLYFRSSKPTTTTTPWLESLRGWDQPAGPVLRPPCRRRRRTRDQGPGAWHHISRMKDPSCSVNASPTRLLPPPPPPPRSSLPQTACSQRGSATVDRFLNSCPGFDPEHILVSYKKVVEDKLLWSLMRHYCLYIYNV